MQRLLTIVAVLIAVGYRAWLHFSTPLVQGLNGAYYLVQARSLIEKMALAIPDLPLVFTLQAGLASLIHLVSPLDVNHSVILAVKTVDSIMFPLAILPIMALGGAWSQKRGADWVMIALAGLVITAGEAALSMVGEFEKNSLGLGLLCGLAWALWRWARHPGRAEVLTVVLFMGLIGLTHIGVFGTSLVFAGSTFLSLAAAHGREGVKRAGRLLLLAAPVVALAAALVFWKFDPSRINKLLHAFSDPADYFTGGPQGPMRRPGPGPGGSLQWLNLAVLGGAAVTAAVVAWRRRRLDGEGNVAVITGAALTVIALTGPWVQGDKSMRFFYNALPLAVLCLLFALLHIPRPRLRAAVGLLLLGGIFAAAIPRVVQGGRPIISQEAKAELDDMAARVKSPGETLVVARHGLEWWTAWTLHTHIAQAQAVSSEDWKKFKQVWFLESKGGMTGPPMGGGFMFGLLGPPPGGPGGGPGNRRGMGPGGGPPGFSLGGPRGGRGGPVGINGMMGAPIPENAETLFDGRYFRLAWVRQPPPFVTGREAGPLDVFADMDEAMRQD